MYLASPGAIICQLGPLTIRYYGVMIALGFILALIAAAKLAKKLALNVDNLISLALWSFIAGILGARAYYVLLSLDNFAGNPAGMFAIWNGGLSIHGGIIGGIIAAYFYLRSQKLPFWPYADVMGAAIPLAQAVGRWGNFFNSEAYGLPVGESFPLKLYIPQASRNLQYHSYEYFHPTFLYESIWNLVTFILIYFFVVQRTRQYPGMTFFTYLALYSIGRITIEPFRVDTVSYFLGMPVPQLVSAITLAIALCAMLAIFQKHNENDKAQDVINS
ncbi:MAG: Phosphatidylglycerol--prolipoprotein diacylglyceryl transferase [Cyanobacteriota bacterium erpe_2018_sw_39hr_WHONDRS-SW48-000098_B_bin.30]|jgi:phosphatidylglycerol:prolipoprotein diacylglycerol transferase|nr:prolipoprotein diacylglyceryl transferase [Candidatus Obscuribacter sp.]MDQ5966438.1 Phosphatidylglycerol--prolipoprotein diacylglyceryl transferase [Cyanobacteriota bacterium erpe_2018_sw_39hr_WHONDRS-SW48-000098_B_bin.30]